MNQLQSFNFESQEIRTYTDDQGNPWWIARDICLVLEHTDISKAVSRLDDDEKLTRTMFVAGQNRSVNLINESGLYNLIMTSRLDKAKNFRKWVTSEVLPAIRKTGSYRHTSELSRLQILEMALASEKALIEAQAQLAIAAPKIQGYDLLMNSDGLILPGLAAKNLGFSPQKLFFELLSLNKYAYYKTEGKRSFWVATEKAIKQGLLVMKLGTHDEKEEQVSHQQMYVTIKGMDRFRHLAPK